MSEIPTAVRKLLYAHVESLEELELLVLLARHPTRSWTAADVDEKLQLGWSSALNALQSVRRSGLCEVDDGGDEPGYQLVRRDPLVRSTVLELLRVYEADRFALMKLVSEAAMARVRGSMERAFADAFVLGDRKKRDG